MTAALTEILAKNNAVILDIGQADIHNNLSLGILFQSSEGNSGDILKELLFKSYELDVNIRFNPITEEAYDLSLIHISFGRVVLRAVFQDMIYLII